MVFLNILVVLLLLSAMIIVHEFGHWIVARKLGFQTPIFGFGLPFGGHIKLGHWNETEFRFHWFVLGGYVAIPELGDESAEELKDELPDLKPLQSFSVWKRAAVASAGVVFNIIFAYIMCLIMVATLGPPSEDKQVIITELLNSTKSVSSYKTKTNPIAAEAGLKKGDVILRINDVEIDTPTKVVKVVTANKLKEVKIDVKRTYFKDNEKKTKVLTKTVIPNKDGKIGIGIGLAGTGEYSTPSKNPLMWFVQAAKVLWQWTLSMLISLGMLIGGLFGFSAVGAPKMGAGDLHGIVAIVSVFAQALTVDFREIYRWSALISVNLAIINLLPIPALDGGHLMFMFIEKIRGEKLNDNVQQKAIQAGFVFLIALMCFVIINDIRGIITGKFNLATEEEAEIINKKD